MSAADSSRFSFVYPESMRRELLALGPCGSRRCETGPAGRRARGFDGVPHADRADGAAAAGAVHDRDRLSQLLLEQSTDDARRRVGAAAGCPRHDELDRALGIRGKRDARKRECGERSERASE